MAVLVTVCAFLLWQRDLFLLHRMETLALPRVLHACQASMQKIHDSSLKLSMNGKNDYYSALHDGSKVKWVLEGTLTLNHEEAFFECDALEEQKSVTVTYTESSMFWTPPPF